MNKEIHGPLYARASTGKIKRWEAVVTHDEDGVNLTTVAGYIDGKLTCSKPKEIKGKNIGKANETTPWEQAQSDALSKVNKKLDEDYKYSRIEAECDATIELPMLAQKYSERKHKIEWPALAQPKLNGVRCIARLTENDPEYISRRGKKYGTLDHLNKDVEKLASKIEKPLDGEIFHPEWGFQDILRAVKKYRPSISEQLEYWVYDIVVPDMTCEERLKLLAKQFKEDPENVNPRLGNIVLVPTVEVNSEEEMMKYHKAWTELGFEGTIIRNKKGKYVLKNRSVDLQKYKDFLDDEYEITGGEEATGNDKGTIVFICQTKDGKSFKVRPKGTREARTKWFQEIEKIKGQLLTVRYQNLSEDGIPIFPVGLALRNYED